MEIISVRFISGIKGYWKQESDIKKKIERAAEAALCVLRFLIEVNAVAYRFRYLQSVVRLIPKCFAAAVWLSPQSFSTCITISWFMASRN